MLYNFAEEKQKRDSKRGKRNGWGFGKLIADLIYKPLDDVLDLVTAPNPISFIREPVSVIPFGQYQINTQFGMNR